MQEAVTEDAADIAPAAANAAQTGQHQLTAQDSMDEPITPSGDHDGQLGTRVNTDLAALEVVAKAVDGADEEEAADVSGSGALLPIASVDAAGTARQGAGRARGKKQFPPGASWHSF